MTRPHPPATRRLAALQHALGFALGLALGAVLINQGMRSAPSAVSHHPHHSDVARDR